MHIRVDYADQDRNKWVDLREVKYKVYIQTEVTLVICFGLNKLYSHEVYSKEDQDDALCNISSILFCSEWSSVDVPVHVC